GTVPGGIHMENPAMATTNHTNGAHAEELPGFRQWAEEMDQKYREGILLAAAKRALERGVYRCDCEDATCEACILDRVIAEIDGGPEASIDLAKLEEESRPIRRGV